MNTTEPKTEASETDRIAGRMVHRATEAKEYLISIENQITFLKTRIPEGADGYEKKLQDLSDRWVRLTRAIADYEKADKIVRVFPALLWAAESGLASLDAHIKSGLHGAELKADMKKIADLIRRAVVAGEDALK